MDRIRTFSRSAVIDEDDAYIEKGANVQHINPDTYNHASKRK